MKGGIFRGDGVPRPDSMKLGLAEISVLVLCTRGGDLAAVEDALSDAGFLVVPAPDANAMDLLPAPARYALVELSIPGALDLLRRADTMTIAVVGPHEHEHAALTAGAIATLRRPLHADDVLAHLRRFRTHHVRHVPDHEAIERDQANAGVELLERALASVASDLLPRLRASGRLLQAARHAQTTAGSSGEGAPGPLIDEALRSLDEVADRLGSLAELGGRAAPWVERVSLLQVAQAAIAATPNHAGVAIDVDGRVDVSGWGDAATLERVVADLLLHALEAVRGAPDPRVHVRVYGTLTEARICIRHLQPQLDVSEVESVFVPFLRPAQAGDELALIRARHAVAHMGGALTVASEAGSRVVFRVRLRTGRAFLPREEMESPPASHAQVRTPAASSGPEILVVEDDEETRTAIAEALEGEGYTVTCAANGKEALAVMATRRPAAMLVDLMMPVMDGWQLLTALKESGDFADIPVVVFSAMTARRPVATRFVAKPMRLQTLLAAVREACGRVDA